MSIGPDNSRDNYSLLLSTNARLESVFVYDNANNVSSPEMPLESAEQSLLERLAKKSEPQPALLTLKGLIRAHAALIYSELDRHLNPLTFRNDDIAPLARMDEAEIASIDREPVYIRTDTEADYDILLDEKEPEVGRFDIEIRRGITAEQDIQQFNRQLNQGFMAILGKVDLKRATAEIENTVRPQLTEEKTIAVPHRRFSAKNRLEKPIKVTLRKGETEQFREDIQEVRMLMGIFGVEDASRQPAESLIELWKKRGRNHMELVNLFMYIVGRKQELRESPGAHFRYSVKDFENYSPKFSKFELENTLAQRTRTILQVKFGLTSTEVDELHGLADSDVNNARLNYLAWVANYPGMVNTASDARERFKKQIGSHDHMLAAMQGLFQTASREIREETLRHRVKMSEDYWSDYGAIDYDKSIPDELDAYNVKLLFLRTAWLLGAYLFTKEKIDVYLQKALQ